MSYGQHERPLIALIAALGAQPQAGPGPILAAWVQESSGPDCAVLLGSLGAGWETLANSGGDAPAASLEAPDGLPWNLVGRMARGTWGKLGPGELRASPALLARGVAEALLGVGDCGGRALWLESRAVGLLDRDWAVAALTLLGEREDGARLRAARASAAELDARARIALGNRHDLRNQLSLAHLELERAQLEPQGGLGGLRLALEGARRLAQEPLEPGLAFAGVARARVGELEIPLAPLLQDELRAAQRLAGRGHEVRIELCCAAALTCRGEPSDLRRWVLNATLNALRACRTGGRVRVEGRGHADGVRLSIQDEGPGMGAEDARRLFQPGCSGSGGSGFGSAALESCARALGATFELETELGVGTCLSLELRGVSSARIQRQRAPS